MIILFLIQRRFVFNGIDYGLPLVLQNINGNLERAKWKNTLEYDISLRRIFYGLILEINRT